MPGEPAWWRDRVLWAALLAALALRAAPMLWWGWSGEDCTRDECIYKIVARPILQGEGLGLSPKFWLPAPGLPYVMAACHELLGSFEAVKWVHWALTVPLISVLFRLADRVGGRRSARAMAGLFAVHPTFIFFVGTMWTEIFYTLWLCAAVLATLWAREGAPRRAVLAGLLLGICVLFRGVATYVGPLCVLGLLAPEAGVVGREAWRAAAWSRRRHAGAFVAAMLLVVLPYSVSASARWGGLVVSDATLGHVAALGNDVYPPVTFDYAIGQLTGRVYGQTLDEGRRDCPRRDGPLAHDRCEVRRAAAWVWANPVEFLRRVPIRLAQLFNPHSFLTRHVRWNYWPGLPWAAKEGLIVYQVLFTWLVVLGGSVVAWARGRGPYLLLMASIIGYHVAVIGALYGLTRFRLPLEPLWMVYLAWGLADPRGTWAALRSSRTRLAGAAVTVAVLAPLLGTYVWTGFPGLGW
jgi:hypothetical protein